MCIVVVKVINTEKNYFKLSTRDEYHETPYHLDIMSLAYLVYSDDGVGAGVSPIL